MGWFNRRKHNTSADGGGEVELPALIPLKDLPRPDEPVAFLGPHVDDTIPGFVFLRWDTAAGVLAVAYETTREGYRGKPTWVRQSKPEIRCLIQVAGQFQTPDGPDVLDYALDGGDRALMWRHYARAIGQPAPYWPWNLPHPELIMAWRPGHDAVTAVPQQSPDLTSLLALSALYPADSDVARVLLHYYFKSLRDAAGGSAMVITANTIEKEDWPRMSSQLTMAARSVDVPEVPDELPAERMRYAFAEIFARKDTLAELVVRQLRQWGATMYFPFGSYERYRAGECVLLEEWVRQLDEVPGHVPDPAFAFMVTAEDQTARRLVDRETGAPVGEVTDIHGRVIEYVTLRPRRLPASSPLAEIIIDCAGHEVWVRSEDGTLYPAPGGKYDLAWGYSGSSIAPLIERLLDDITTEPIDSPEPPKNNGLTALTKKEVPDGTVYTRDALERARARPR